MWLEKTLNNKNNNRNRFWSVMAGKYTTESCQPSAEKYSELCQTSNMLTVSVKCPILDIWPLQCLGSNFNLWKKILNCIAWKIENLRAQFFMFVKYCLGSRCVFCYFVYAKITYVCACAQLPNPWTL